MKFFQKKAPSPECTTAPTQTLSYFLSTQVTLGQIKTLFTALHFHNRIKIEQGILETSQKRQAVFTCSPSERLR